jgi:hypothetical protein
MSLRLTIILTLVLAVAAFVIPPVLARGSQYAFDVELFVSVIWFSLAVCAVAKYRLRGLRVLVGAAPALYWPFWAVALVIACSVYHNCL